MKIEQKCRNSPIIEKAVSETAGYFGFTRMFPDGSFENVIVRYSEKGRSSALEEITRSYDRYHSTLNKGETL